MKLRIAILIALVAGIASIAAHEGHDSEPAGIFQFSGGADEGPDANVPPNDMRFFHSRQIGLAGADSPGPETPIPILGGTRLTGRAGGFEVGLMNIQQHEEGSTPATNFTVVRLRRNVLANSDIGVMFNNKEEFGSPRFNRVVGMDANFRFTQALAPYSYLAKAFAPSGGDGNLAGRIALHYITRERPVNRSNWPSIHAIIAIPPN